MFKSKTRSINIPQSEHGRLAGILASLWGNANYALPPVKHESFIAGVALHDRGYGLLDAFAIGELSEPDWLALTAKGFNLTFSDPVADLITRYHLRRLVRSNHAEAGRTLLQMMDKEIAAQLHANALSHELFQRIDRVTDFCDSISFDFCFERPTEGDRFVYPDFQKDVQVRLSYQIRGNEIRVDPWIFSAPSYESFIVSYQRDGYPQKLEPLIVPVQISPF